MNPYIINQEPQKLFATTQGNAMQDQFHAQQMQQMAQLASQAGKSAPAQGSNVLALANMLRKTQPTSNTDFLTGNYTAPSVGMNPNANIGYNIDSMSGYGLK